MVIEAPVLRYYDPKLKSTLQCNASKSGLGAVILQNEQPVAYISRSRTKAKQDYAQIEKEALAILFACQHCVHECAD